MASASRADRFEHHGPGPGPDTPWAALAAGRWSDARRGFERALGSGEDPALLEGLAWAAWWLDDEEATFAARPRAFALHRERGDTVGAARAATWCASDHLDFRGETAAAAGWLEQARRLLDTVPPCPEHSWLAFQRGYLALLAGEGEEARRLGAQAAEGGRACGLADTEMLGLALEGSALVALGAPRDGMRRLDEAGAVALVAPAQLPIAKGWTWCLVIAACESLGDLDRAGEWCDRVDELSRAWAVRHLRGICRTHYATLDMWRGAWERAEEQLDAALEDFSRSRPVLVSSAVVALAELRRRQGRLDEAQRLLERAAGSALAPLRHAALALDAGDALAAAELADRCLRRLPVRRDAARASALELLVRARAAAGDPDGAQAAVAELAEIAELAGTPPLRAAARLAAGRVVAAGGDHDRARPLLEDAVDLLAAAGAPFEAAHARLDLAATLAALGRPDAARDEARAALDVLRRLGAGSEAARARALLAELGEHAGPLTPRECEVLALIAEGATNAQVAARLVVSEHTVHRHVANIMGKLGVASRTAAVTEALRQGWRPQAPRATARSAADGPSG